MANGGLAAIGVFRKHLSDKTTKTKYPTIVRTAEMIAEEEAEEKNKMTIEDLAPQVAVSAKKPKNYNALIVLSVISMHGLIHDLCLHLWI